MTGSQSPRRRAIQAFYRNGACWGLGNGMVSSSLILYLAGTYGAKGLAIALIRAVPGFVGVLRLGMPILIDAVGRRQLFCTRMFFASSIVLVLLPVVSMPGFLPSPKLSLVVLVTMWAMYHLLQFLGLVALWSWIGDVVPDSIRGRFIGRRGALLNAFQVVGMLIGGSGSWWWRGRCQNSGHDDLIWVGYAACAVIGALLLGLAVWPLVRAPVAIQKEESTALDIRQHCQEIFAPFADRGYRRFLAYGGWFSLANGISGAASFLFQMRVLDISYAGRMALKSTAEGTQSIIMPRVGQAIDRWGGVPVLVVSQVLVSLSLLFFLAATPTHWWWIIGAYVLWIAYAGVNTAMPKLMLSLTPKAQYTSYAAAWFAWLELVYALSTIAGGLLFDWASKNFTPRLWAGFRVDHFAAIFLLGFVLRISAAAWAARIREPGR